MLGLNLRIFAFIGGAGINPPALPGFPMSLSVVEFKKFIPEICIPLMPPPPTPIGVEARVFHPTELSLMLADSFMLQELKLSGVPRLGRGGPMVVFKLQGVVVGQLTGPLSTTLIISFM